MIDNKTKINPGCHNAYMASDLIGYIALLVIIVALIIHFIGKTDAHAEVALSFAFNSIETESKVQTIFCSFNGKFIPFEKVDSLILKMKNEIYRSREDEVTTNYRQYTDFQVNGHTNDNLFIFTDLEFLTDQALGISDELSFGTGFGYTGEIFDIQAGLYFRSSDEDEMVSKIRSHLNLPVVDDSISFIWDNGLDLNLNYVNDFRTSNLLYIKIVLHKYINFETGIEVNYLHEDPDLEDSEAINTTRRYFIGGSLAF